MQQVSSRFQSTMASTIKYMDFVSTARFEMEKIKVIDLVFSSLCAALANFQVLGLRELFSKASPSFSYSQQLDKTTLDMILKASGGVPLQSWDLDMIISEYQSEGGNNLSFEAFERDFREFQNG